MVKKLSHTERLQRFESKIRVTPYCWVWDGSINNCGYGQGARVWADETVAHRTAYRVYKGDLPKDLQVDHLCSTRNCVNPEHLEAVTKRENARRMVERRGWVEGGKKYIPVRDREGFIPEAKRDTGLCSRGHRQTPDVEYRWVGDAGSSGGSKVKLCRVCAKAVKKFYKLGLKSSYLDSYLDTLENKSLEAFDIDDEVLYSYFSGRGGLDPQEAKALTKLERRLTKRGYTPPRTTPTPQ